MLLSENSFIVLEFVKFEIGGKRWQLEWYIVDNMPKRTQFHNLFDVNELEMNKYKNEATNHYKNQEKELNSVTCQRVGDE